jgi:zinc/manganese transport system permease protein
MSLSAIEWGILLPAFAAGLAVLATHVPLGREVLARGIIFIDLAVAQTATLGLVLADSLGPETVGWAGQGFALGAALAASALLAWTEPRAGRLQEALIGVLFVLTASTAFLLLAARPQAGEHLQELLAGQILWAGWRQIGGAALVAAGVLLLWHGLPGWRQRLFYPMFALSITVSVQLAGVYLVFASLILPALAAHLLNSRAGLAMGYAVGILGYALGLSLSAAADLPSGPLIVVCLAACALLARLAANGYSSQRSAHPHPSSGDSS